MIGEWLKAEGAGFARAGRRLTSRLHFIDSAAVELNGRVAPPQFKQLKLVLFVLSPGYSLVFLFGFNSIIPVETAKSSVDLFGLATREPIVNFLVGSESELLVAASQRREE